MPIESGKTLLYEERGEEKKTQNLADEAESERHILLHEIASIFSFLERFGSLKKELVSFLYLLVCIDFFCNYILLIQIIFLNYPTFKQ